MSDGPYRSLPMSRGWKRLAECAENENFDRDDTCAAASHALATTWQNEVPADVMSDVRAVFLEREPDLFFDARVARIEAVAASAAGYGLGRQFVAHASSVMAEGLTGEAGLEEATKRALIACAARGSRQIDEHYCRKATKPLVHQVRSRVAQAMDAADMRKLARQCSGLEKRASRRAAMPKHAGLDDGVALV